MGKASGGVSGYKYYFDAHLIAGLADGGSSPDSLVKDGLLQFLAGDRIAWNGLESGIVTGNSTIFINAPELFGGDEKEGGIVGYADVMFGGHGQGPSAYLLAKQGGFQPAYIGRFSIVFKGGQICANNPYMKPWAIARRRITGDWLAPDGTPMECWYEEKAPIVLEGGSPGGPSDVLPDARFLGIGQIGAGLRAAIRPISYHGVFIGPDDIDVTGVNASAVRCAVLMGNKVFAIANDGTSRVATLPNFNGPWLTGPTPPAGANSTTLARSGARVFASSSSSATLKFIESADDAVFSDGGTATGGFINNLICSAAGNGAGLVACNGYGSLWGSGDNGDSLFKGVDLFYDPYSGPNASRFYTHQRSIDCDGSRVGIGGGDVYPVVYFTDDWGASVTRSSIPGDLNRGSGVGQLKHCGGDNWLLALPSDAGTPNDDGLLLSTDNLATFNRVALPRPLYFGQQWEMSIAHDIYSNRVTIAGTDRDTGERVFLQTDDFSDWTELDNSDTGSYGVVDIGPVSFTPSPPTPPVAGRYCMNPAHMIYQVRTDPRAMNWPIESIDDDNFRDVAAKLYAEGLGLNMGWRKGVTFGEYINIIEQHAGIVHVRDRRSGLFKLRMLRKDYEIEDLPVFGPHNCRIAGKAQRPSPADTVNELRCTYTDYRDWKEKVTTVRNPAAIQANGGVVISKSHDLSGLPTETLAQRVGQMILDQMSTPLWKFDLEFLRGADLLERGQPFLLQDMPDPGMQIVMRVGDKIDYGNAAEGIIRAPVVEDIFALPDAVYTGTMGPPNSPGGIEPLPAEATLLEASYRDLAAQLSATDLAALPEDAGYVASVAVRANTDHRDYDLLTRLDPVAFQRAARGDFAGSAVLRARIEPLDVNAPIESVVDLARFTEGSLAMLGEGATAELVRIDGVSSGLFHLGRGCCDTVARFWPAGTRLWGLDDYAAADPTQYMDGETVDAKVLTRTGAGVLSETDAETLSMTMNSRAIRPYAPGAPEANGEPAIAGTTVPATLPEDPGIPAGEPAPVGSTGTPPGGYVGVPYSNVGAFGDPWRDEGETSYRYVTGAFWPGATVNHGGLATYGKWVNELTGIPLEAGDYDVTTRTESGDGFFEQAHSVTIAPKPAYAVLDLSRRPAWDALAHSEALPPSSEVVTRGAPVVDCAGWTDGKRYGEFTIVEGASFGGIYLGVHAAGLDNLNIGPSNPGTVTYTTPVGAGTYGVAYDTATGSFYMRDAGGWIFVGPTETAIKFGPTTSENGRFRFAASGGPEATITANFGNEPWVYGLPAGFDGVPMPASIIVPAMWDVQKLTVGSLAVVSRNADGSWNAAGNLITNDFSILGTFGKSAGKHQVEMTVREVRSESVGLAVATFDRADGRLGEAGTEDSIGASYGAEGGTPMIHIRTCFAGVHAAYDHVWPLGSGHVGRFTFAQDHTAGTVAVYADGVLIRTLAGVPAATWFPAAACGYAANTNLIATGLLYPVATFDDWTVTV